MLNALPYWATLTFGFMWLGDRLYPRYPDPSAEGARPEARAQARRNFLFMGLVLVQFDMVELLEQIENVSYNSRAVIAFPGILWGAYVVFRMRSLALRDDRDEGTSAQEGSGRNGLTWMGPLFRWSAGLVAVVSPLLAAVTVRWPRPFWCHIS